MLHTLPDGVLPLAMTLVVSSALGIFTFVVSEGNVKTDVFLSPKFELGPGTVVNRYYHDIPFPRGHIAVKSFNGEVVDESGIPVPLHETYLHHWVVFRAYQRKDDTRRVDFDGQNLLHQSDFLYVRNSGVCQERSLGQYFGLGSETRKTDTYVPDPYGIEVGNPAEIPDGYEERWILNVHAIDTRGVEDKLGCIECRCDLYDVTKDEYGRPLSPDYKGGLDCCYDRTQCRKQPGFQGPRRSLYLRYTVKWINLSKSIIPVKIYIFDVTDSLRRLNNSTSDSLQHNCRVEYEVKSCSEAAAAANDCIHVKKTSVPLTKGGYVIYGVAHQHSGGIGSTLYGEDGRAICSSIPAYGKGTEAGNEQGYIVGMSTCYPAPGSVKINDGEILTVLSNYRSTQSHTGAMGLFYLMIAERLPQPAQSHLHSFLQYVKDMWFDRWMY